jgi:hypothetical protein
MRREGSTGEFTIKRGKNKQASLYRLSAYAAYLCITFRISNLLYLLSQS